MEWLYKGLEQYTYITIRSLVFKTIALVAVFLLIRNQDDVLIYAGISIFASSASNILNFIHAHRLIDFRYRQKIDLRRHMKPVLVLFAMTCAFTLFTNLDEVMLGFIRPNAEVGIYHAAVRIKIALVDIITALSVVLLPRASYYVEQRRTKDFLRITDKGMHFVLVCGAGLTVYFMLYARETVLFLFGPEFEESILPMILIMPVVLLTGMTRVMGNQILIPQGRERIVLYSVVSGAVADVILNAILIPRFGPSGAVIGTLAAEMIIVLVQFPRVKDEVGGTARSFLSWRVLLALAMSVGASVWVKQLQVGLLWRLILSSLLYFVVYLGILLIMKEPLVVEAYQWVKGRKR
jgi:O-antigen/teichoic acid export membrane protein